MLGCLMFINLHKTCFHGEIPRSPVDLLNNFLISACLIPGKILNDETALKEYKIDEKNFVVVMVTKVSNHFF